MSAMDIRNWNLCFICQETRQDALTNPANSIKLRGQPAKIEACYQELLNNIDQLNLLDEIPSFVVLDDISGGYSGGNNCLKVMKENNVVWHKKAQLIPKR